MNSIQRSMSAVTNFITEVGPHLLPLGAVVFSYKGLEQRGIETEQIWALIFLLVIFTGLLSESLKKAVDLWRNNRARSIVVCFLAIGLFLLEVVLVHEGMVWAFGSLLEGWMLWASAVFFSLINLFCKFGFIDGVCNKQPETPDNLELNDRIAKVAAMIDTKIN